jgi:hypothetical protein
MLSSSLIVLRNILSNPLYFLFSYLSILADVCSESPRKVKTSVFIEYILSG